MLTEEIQRDFEPFTQHEKVFKKISLCSLYLSQNYSTQTLSRKKKKK